jgi:hypothetical protein
MLAACYHCPYAQQSCSGLLPTETAVDAELAAHDGGSQEVLKASNASAVVETVL